MQKSRLQIIHKIAGAIQSYCEAALGSQEQKTGVVQGKSINENLYDDGPFADVYLFLLLKRAQSFQHSLFHPAECSHLVSISQKFHQQKFPHFQPFVTNFGTHKHFSHLR